MKKIILCLMAVGLVLVSCDPSKSEKDFDPVAYTSADGLVTFSQYSDEAHTQTASDGNYITYTTSPATTVCIYNSKADGSENILATGPSGSFVLAPSRGQSEDQTVNIRIVNSDNSVVTSTATLHVYVQQELAQEIKLLASDLYGSKIWKWDYSFRADSAVWGNAGYDAGSGEGAWANGIWWGFNTANAEALEGQLNHATDGNGTKYAGGAYMVLTEGGDITSYTESGEQIASGSYTVAGYDGSLHASADGGQAEYSYGNFNVTAGTILWPYRINSNGLKPETFEIVALDATHLQLVDPGASPGGWAECTWWAFTSTSDADGSLTDFSSKSWTWDTEFRDDGAVWGNGGYAAGSGEGAWANGIWWGMQPTEDVMEGQLNHATDGNGLKYVGEAYMTFNRSLGTVTSYTADGTEIASGAYSISGWDNGNLSASADGSQAQYKLGNLDVTAGSILWPYRINSDGYKPETFEIVRLDGNHLQLVDPGASPGGWAECTWWAFKKK